MRTRNQSKRSQEPSGSENVVKGLDDSETRGPMKLQHENVLGTLTNISKQAVGRFLRQGSSRKASRGKRQEGSLSHGESNDMIEEEMQKADGELFSSAVVAGRDAKGRTPTGEDAEGIVHHSFPAKTEETDEPDWEDGSVSISDVRENLSNNLEREVTVEFSKSPSSAKRKVIRRASVEDKELAELVHKVHLLCLVGRGRLVDRACDDPLIQASLLSLVPTQLQDMVKVPKMKANALTALVDWFHGNFHVRNASSSERSFTSSMAYALETREGTAEEVAALSVALFRALNLTARYCMKWYTIASQRVNSQWWGQVLVPLKQLESGATEGVVPLEMQLENASSELHKLKAVKVSDSLEVYSNETAGSSSAREHLPSLTQVFGIEASKLLGMNIDVKSPIQSPGVGSRSSLEDMELETRALTEPLPTNQLAYKNHQLYAIERWLTRYQILHPKGPILGYCSGHPVYPRTCVQTLQTKHRWLREGLQVKENECPAKVVKRSQKSKMSSEPSISEEDDGEGTIELYGKWQMEPLQLPHAVNGIVPKNERGQVDVWSEKCLPPGTVHLRLPRLVPVVKRLEIDFAPAMVGFEFRNGRSLPIFEGLVVCTEFKHAIMEAYAEEEERRQAQEKKWNESQALSRWYQLISNMVTRRRLKNSYEVGSTSQAHHNLLHQKDDQCMAQICDHRGSDLSGEFHQEYVQDHGGSALDYRPAAAFASDHEHVFPVENQSFDEESSVRTKWCPCGFSIQVEEM
ncbi:DNA repair protein RAD4 isoform X3 [Magnolia sinica]|uniref:DNA repair protein RAD4 isoform X3 n=1 Tax=Magnolia sinica TaxID=86752 RepID=UPI0026581ECE|nr:DNA repair protein RAD4 isoform X3 [Magnolia sinica]